MSAVQKLQGKRYYTKTNIFYERPDRIFSTNYHKGSILPAGSQVTIIGATRKTISFAHLSRRFRIVYHRRHSGPNMQDYFDDMFSPTEVLGAGSPYGSFNAAEKQAIKAGRIEVGMSKAAVLMSWGLPPRSLTHSQDSDVWTYMYHRFRRASVRFANGQVVEAPRQR